MSGIRKQSRWLFHHLMVGALLVSATSSFAAQPKYARQSTDVELSPNAPIVEAEISKEKPTDSRLKYALGFSLKSSPRYLGSNERKLSVRPIVGIQYGRFKLRSSGASAVMGFGDASQNSGASADLIQTRNLKLKASVRINRGRTASDSATLYGLAPIRRSLIGRFSATYLLNKHWSLGGVLGWDLLNRGSGATATGSISYQRHLTLKLRLATALGVSWGNATHMNAYFGVPVSAQTATRNEFTPGSGLKSVNLATNLMGAINNDWIAFGGIGITRILGSAADSPLTKSRSAMTATIGIAYRCCR